MSQNLFQESTVMPNWMDILNATTRSLVPKGAIQGLQESLAPGSSEELPEGSDNMLLNMLSMERLGQVPGALADIAENIGEYPMETLGGFASGAMGGAAEQINPANLAGLAIPALRGVFPRGGAMLDDVARAMPEQPAYGRQKFDVVEPRPPAQVNPSMDDVDAIIADSRRRQARVPQATGWYRGPGAQTASARNMPPEFVPRGGEAVFNAGKPAIGPQTNLPPRPIGARPMPGPRPVPPQGAPTPAVSHAGVPAGNMIDPVGERLAQIEEAIRARFNQQPPNGYGRGPRPGLPR